MVTVPARKPAACASLAVMAALTACSGMQMDPERLAANIQVQPHAMALAPAEQLTQLAMDATVEACNRNDVDIELHRADWAAQLDGMVVGAGTVQGPKTLPAQKCVHLPVKGTMDLSLMGGAALMALMQGRNPTPDLQVDVTAGAYGLSLRRTVKLDAAAFLKQMMGPAAP